MTDNKLPSLNKWDRERLENSIKELGVKLPVVFDQTGRVIDGYHRKEIAEGLGIDYPRETIVVENEEEFDRLSTELNLARRHLSQEQISNWYKVRKQIALDARQNGATQQEAADKVGVDRSTLSLWENTSDEDESSSNVSTHNAGRPPDNRIKLDKSLHDEIWERRQGGETTVALAEEYGVSKQHISSICAQVSKLKKKETEIEQAKEDAEISDEIEARVYYGDMSDPDIQNLIESNSVDMILTDPPYPGEYLHLWDELATLAERVLKPSGVLVAYSGQTYLDQVMSKLSKTLKYYWTVALIHSGGNQLVQGRNILCEWKPILIFQKAPFKLLNQMPDTIKGTGREKGLHKWQQAEGELTSIIESLSYPGHTILDPFAGSGTSVVAALKNNRRAIAIEIEKDNITVIKNRIVTEVK